MQIDKGRRIRLADVFGDDQPFEAVVLATGPGLTIDLACFGLDAAGKLSDERYMAFFNQPATPCGGVTQQGALFAFALERLPASIERLVLTAAIDGAGSMDQLTQGHVQLQRDGVPSARFAFSGADFDGERALLLAEIYRKDGAWRFAATGQGFNGGMDALVRHFGAAPAGAPAPAGLAIEIVADQTIGYAAIQNNVPVVRALVLHNAGAEPLHDVSVAIHCEPAFAIGARVTCDCILPGERRTISPLDLQPAHAYLSALDEAERAAICVSASAGQTLLAETRRPIDVLAYEQWAGTRSLPELLAAFCMPNSPVVDQLIGFAARLLRADSPGSAMNGYQSKHREMVWRQVSALYATVLAEKLDYVSGPASFGRDGQKIRTAERIMEGKVANCLDLAMLFASCLEQAGLHPLVLVKEGHAWVGVWLIETSFAAALIDDVQAVRKRVRSGELIVFETTGITAARRASLRWACTAGEEHLDEESSFQYAIDIRRARELQIRPLPSRARHVDLADPALDDTLAAIEEMPALPPLDPALLPVPDTANPETPEGRLARWKSKLLDLTLRNRLLNFKPVKTTLRVICPDPGALEDILSEGKEFKIRPMPVLMTGADHRDAAVYLERHGASPLDALATDALGRREIIVDVPEAELDARLVEIFRAAGTGLEEGGANTLFLAFGLLQWQQSREAEADAEAHHLAPILLIPVTLSRLSVRSGFRLTRHDDDALINPTLIQKLWQDFSLKLPSFEVLPTDEKGIDVAKVLQIFRLHVTDFKGWEVKDQVHLGIFSFTKFLMWKDLQDRHTQLMDNTVVAHLINNPGKAFAQSDIGYAPGTLDETHRPQDLFAPLLSDSSQLRAICVASEGNHLVVQGPPGTGKSQTITNLIAHLLASGKTVLFVSEKMAALEVVHRRLHSLGLGAFCLEVHSSKAKKSSVLKQLGEALDAAGTRTVKDWELEAERLAALRRELNGVPQALHRVYPNDLTVYDAIGVCIKHNDKRPAPVAWPDPAIHTRAQLETLRDTSRQMAALAGQLASLAGNPLGSIANEDWTPTWQQSLLDGATSLEGAAKLLRERATAALDLFGLRAAALSFADLAAFDRLADLLLRAPSIPVGVARAAHDEASRTTLGLLRQHGVRRSELWNALGGQYRDEAAGLNAAELRTQWAEAQTSWWPRSWFAKRGLASRLAPSRVDLRRPQEQDIAPFLDTLGKLNAEDLVLKTMESAARLMLQDPFDARHADWSMVEAAQHWARDFADAVTQMAGSDVAQAQALRGTLQVFVTDQRAMLRPEGAAGALLLHYRAALQDFTAQAGQVGALAHTGAHLGHGLKQPAAIDGVLATLRGWQSAARQLQPWCLWRRVRARAIALGLQGLVDFLESVETGLSDIPAFFEYSYQNWWVRKIIDREPVLSSFSSADHERKIAEFRLVDARFQLLTQQYIVARLAAQIPSSAGLIPGADSEMGKLRRELQKQRKHMPIRQLVQSLPGLMPKLKPCLLMSPLSVAQYLDASHPQFDVVIFDEASQIPVWDAVGAIARGRQLTCVGDPRQLPPTNFFNRLDDGDSGVGEDDIEDLESILDECLSIGMPELSLNWHYRSRHESLITFSNMTYYENRLVTFPSPVTEDRAVRFEHVRGVYDRGGSRTNRAEADAIVKAIEAHYLDPARSGMSLGVVTFNQAQQALIERLLDERRRACAALDQAIAEAAGEPLFIKNLENVQGDERDLIYFSVTYGPDAAGKVNLNFGPLNLEGGQRRLNVAVSRARQGVVVFSTLLPEHIDLSRVRAAGVRDLKNYLEFAIRGARAMAAASTSTPEAGRRVAASSFEHEVMTLLTGQGWTVHAQVGVSAYRLDLGVVDPRSPGRYLLGVECDGPTYHSGATARDRDRLRQHVLEGLGWRLYRVWSTDWWLDPAQALRKLLAHLDRLMLEDAAPDTAPPEAATGAATDAGVEVIEAEQPRFAPYQVASLAAVTGDIHDAASIPTIQNQLLQVVNTEGPVAEVIVVERVVRAWDLARSGRRIDELLRSLVPGQLAQTRDEATFLWPEGVDPLSWEGFRVPTDDQASKRTIDEICLEELGNLALFIVTQHGSAPVNDVARSVCRLLGIARTTAESEERIAQALTQGVALARLQVDNRIASLRNT